MIESIYSKIEKDVLLHQITRIELLAKEKNDAAKWRVNVSPEEESLQSAILMLENQQTFRAHKHILHKREMPMAQEAWIVIAGSVKVLHYDLDDTLINTSVLTAGDSTITYRGGHNYIALEDKTLVYELKTGPYLGQKYDKVFVN